jgi:hypothetical protein
VLSYPPIDQGDDRQGIRHESQKWPDLGTSLFGRTRPNAPLSIETGLIRAELPTLRGTPPERVAPTAETTLARLNWWRNRWP